MKSKVKYTLHCRYTTLHIWRWRFKMSRTLLESSFIDCTADWLESCVSEMMKGSESASNTLWIFPESVR